MKRLYAYGSRELGVEGQFQLEVSVSKAKVEANFIIAESGRCLIALFAKQIFLRLQKIAQARRPSAICA